MLFIERIRIFGLEVWGLIHFRLTAILRLVDLEAMFVPPEQMFHIRLDLSLFQCVNLFALPRIVGGLVGISQNK